MVKAWAFAGALIATGCGYTDAGSGTQTLEVLADFSYASTSGNETAVRVQVNKAGAPVTNPVIVVTDDDTHETFPITRATGNKYSDTLTGYRRRLHIEVTSGDDAIKCQIEAPGRHTIANPLQGETHKRSDDLKIRWQTVDGLRADEVDLKLDKASVSDTLVKDVGEFTVPASILQVSREKVSVVRRNKLIPAGGTGASLIKFEYEVTVEFQVTP